MTGPLPADAGRAWALLMTVFPGSFPPDVFDQMTLERYAEAFGLALEIQEAQAAAAEAR